MIKIKRKNVVFSVEGMEEEEILYTHINENNICSVYELKDTVIINFVDGVYISVSRESCAHPEEYNKLLQKLGRTL
tara:strand:+ start:166 stop:393 length:228 start_codon:yes stop_codon:yes gene_type:complete